MAYSITDFTHNFYAYTDDGGDLNSVSMRNVYASCSGLSVDTDGDPYFAAKHARRRYIHSPAGGAGGKPVTRHYPIAIEQVASPTAPGTIDGIADFALKGYRGEQQRA
jgi:hypothetical protein